MPEPRIDAPLFDLDYPSQGLRVALDGFWATRPLCPKGRDIAALRLRLPLTADGRGTLPPLLDIDAMAPSSSDQAGLARLPPPESCPAFDGLIRAALRSPNGFDRIRDLPLPWGSPAMQPAIGQSELLLYLMPQSISVLAADGPGLLLPLKGQPDPATCALLFSVFAPKARSSHARLAQMAEIERYVRPVAAAQFRYSRLSLGRIRAENLASHPA